MSFLKSRRLWVVVVGVLAVVAVVLAATLIPGPLSGPERFDDGDVGDVTFDDVRGTFANQAAAMASKKDLWSDVDGSSKYVLGDAHATAPESTRPVTLQSAGVSLSDIEVDGYGQGDMDSPVPTNLSVICKVTWVDGGVLSREHNIDDLSAEKGFEAIDEVVLGQVVSFAETFVTESGDYVAAWLSPNAQVGGSEVIQVVFTAPNNDGEVLEGCVYDWDTGIALIPTKALVENDGVVQAQLYVACDISGEEVAKQSVDVSVSDASGIKGVRTGTARQELPVIDTGMSVSIAEPGTEIANDAIEVRLNGSLSSFTQKEYDSDTGCLRLAITPERVARVDVRVHSGKGKAYASTASEMDFAVSRSGKRMRMPDNGEMRVGERVMFITDFWMLHGVEVDSSSYNPNDYAVFTNWESNLYVPRNNGSWSDDAYLDDDGTPYTTGYSFTCSTYNPYILELIRYWEDLELDFNGRVQLGSGNNLSLTGTQGNDENVLIKSSQITSQGSPGRTFVPIAFAGRCYYPAGYSSGAELRDKCLQSIPGYGHETLPNDYGQMYLDGQPFYENVNKPCSVNGTNYNSQIMRHLVMVEDCVTKRQGLSYSKTPEGAYYDGVATPLSDALQGMSDNILEDHNGDVNALNLALLCCHTQQPLYSSPDYFPYVRSGTYGAISARVLAMDRDADEPYAIIGFISSSIGFGMEHANETHGLQAGCGVYKVLLEKTTGFVNLEKGVTL